MALNNKIDGQSVVIKRANRNIFERINGESENGKDKGGTEVRHAWIAPDPVTMPSLFSGGGEDPLAQLDLYCRSHSNSDATNENQSQNRIGGVTSTVADVDELLSVAEFLFGQKTLTSALAIVDSRRSLITKLVAPSGRFVHTIRSSNSSSLAAMDANDPNNSRISDGEHYLCLLSPLQSLRYCSCRSFLEKSTKKVAALRAHKIGFNDENCHDGPPVCKHLLALFLLPHLVAASEAHSNKTSYGHSYSSYPEIKSITEQEFATLVLDRIL